MSEAKNFKKLAKKLMIEEGYGACSIESHKLHNSKDKPRATDNEIERRIDFFVDQNKNNFKPQSSTQSDKDFEGCGKLDLDKLVETIISVCEDVDHGIPQRKEKSVKYWLRRYAWQESKQDSFW